MKYLTGSLSGEGYTLTDMETQPARKYTGSLESGRPAGDGVMELLDGFQIGGTWRGYLLEEGPGWLEFPGGARFDANWYKKNETVWHKRRGAASICIQNDCRNGPGVEIDQNIESIYVGGFRDGRFAGRGALFWKYRLVPGATDSEDPVEISEPDFYIYAGDFVDGELQAGTLYCLRNLAFCRYLVSVHQRRRKANSPVRAEWVNNYGFFQDRARPLLSEFQEAARYLGTAGVN